MAPTRLHAGRGGVPINQFVSAVLLTTVLFIVVTLVPVINAVAIVLIPLPLLFFSIKYGNVKAMGILLISLVLACAAMFRYETDGSIYVLYLLGASGVVLPVILGRFHNIEKRWCMRH